MRTTLLLTNFTAGELSPRLEGRVDLSRYYNGCSQLQNFLVHPHGGATRRSGMRFVALAGNPAAPSRLVPFEFNAEQAYVLEFGANEENQGFMRVFKDQGLVLDESDEPYSIATPYGAGDLDGLRWVQSNDTLILTHPGHAPRRLTREDHDDWTLEEIEFTGRPEDWGEGDWPGLACFFEERLVLAATASKPNTLWFSRSGDYWDFRLDTREVPLEDWDELEIKDSNSDGLRDGKTSDTFTLLDGLTFEQDCVVKGQNPDGEKRWFRYLGGRCIQTSGSDVTVTFTTGIPGGNQLEAVYNASDVLDEDNWEALALGDRIDNPTGESPLDDDGIEITLSAAQSNAIRFLVPRSRLWVGTIGGEWTVGGRTTGDPISPSSVKAGQEGTAGAAYAPTVRAAHVGLFIQRAGLKVREMAYRYESDAYASRNLTLLSEHITAPGLTDLAYAQEPDSVVFCLRSDGILVSLTYEPDQEVYAWARQVTDGTVASLASIYNGAAQRDEPWLVVKRQGNGQEQYCVEFLEAGFNGQLDQGFFVDSGLSYQGQSTYTVTGLGHLAGREVAVLADGAVHRDLTVAQDGSITLDRPASVIHAGLPYTSILSPLRLEGASRQGTDQTKTKRVVQVAARFHQTLGGSIGPSDGDLEPVYYRSSSDAMDSPPGLFTGDKIIKFPRGWERGARISIVQEQPLPMTVLMLVPQVAINQ